ncbi:MAG: carbon-nitrogen hydrolase family protein, partial [Phycisphaerae bacterium]
MPIPASDGRCNLAVLQPALSPDRPDQNLDRVAQQVEALARSAPLDLVVLPEMVDGVTEPGPGDDRTAVLAPFLCRLAERCGVNLIGGSADCPQPAGRPTNRCLVIDRQGKQVGHYDKRVLFGSERQGRSPGTSAGVFDLDGVRVGVLICGDLWHPELARELSGRVDILCVPAKSGVPSQSHARYARTLWQSLALTRAMENGFILAVSDWAAGQHPLHRTEPEAKASAYSTS